MDLAIAGYRLLTRDANRYHTYFPTGSRPRRPRGGDPIGSNRLGLTLGVLLASALTGTWSAFSAVSANPGNTFAAGTVILSDNDGGSAALTLSSAKPGDSATGCVQVTYSGSLDAQVRLYGTTTGTGHRYLDLTVTRGTGGAFPDCAGFTADATDYLGLGAGVVYAGTLQDWADNHATALDDPLPGAVATWTTGTTRS